MKAEVADNSWMLQAIGLSKSFPGVQALAGVRFEVGRGQVHAVMGENGAGKSTLMNLLIGLHTPDAGEIRFKGRRVQIRNPHHARRLGISMIHQELMPFPHLSVAENIFMGQEPTVGGFGWIDHRRMQAEARRLLEDLDMPLSSARKMRELSVAQMQTVEIAKALAHRAEVIIMDEPTSAISTREVEALFRIIHGLSARGVSVIYVSHKMDEVFRIADQITVLRDGQHVATCDAAGLDADQLIGLMVGRKLRSGIPKAPATIGDAALELRGLGRDGKFRDVNLVLRHGEVLGLAGLLGAGRTEIMHALFGLAPADDGEIWIRGQPVRIRHPQDAIRHGLAMVSEDRKEYGLVLPMSVKHNVTLSSLRRYCRGPFIHAGTENRVADESIQTFAIKTRHRNQGVHGLSGGNQQKVVLAKALQTEPQILLLDEPTRGIDIGAKAEIYDLISRLAGAGKAVLLASSEMPELLSLSDRILVLREGTVAAEFDPRQASQEDILRHAMPTAPPSAESGNTFR